MLFLQDHGLTCNNTAALYTELHKMKTQCEMSAKHMQLDRTTTVFDRRNQSKL